MSKSTKSVKTFSHANAGVAKTINEMVANGMLTTVQAGVIAAKSEKDAINMLDKIATQSKPSRKTPAIKQESAKADKTPKTKGKSKAAAQATAEPAAKKERKGREPRTHITCAWCHVRKPATTDNYYRPHRDCYCKLCRKLVAAARRERKAAEHEKAHPGAAAKAAAAKAAAKQAKIDAANAKRAEKHAAAVKEQEAANKAAAKQAAKANSKHKQQAAAAK